MWADLAAKSFEGVAIPAQRVDPRLMVRRSMLMQRTVAMPAAASGVCGDAAPVNKNLNRVFAVDNAGLIADVLVRYAVFMGIFTKDNMVVTLHLCRCPVQDGERLCRQGTKVRQLFFDEATPAASWQLLKRLGVMLVEQLPDTAVQGKERVELLMTQSGVDAQIGVPDAVLDARFVLRLAWSRGFQIGMVMQRPLIGQLREGELVSAVLDDVLLHVVTDDGTGYAAEVRQATVQRIEERLLPCRTQCFDISITAVRQDTDQHGALDHFAGHTVAVTELLAGEIDLQKPSRLMLHAHRGLADFLVPAQMLAELRITISISMDSAVLLP